jgi:capsular polysaccharide biosynthesis protein
MNRRDQLDELEISFWARVIRRRRGLIAVVVVVCTVATVAAILLRGPVHTARTEIFVAGTELGPEVQFVTSRYVAESVEGVLGYEPDVSVSASDTTFIIGIEASATSPDEAARIVDTYAATFVTLREQVADDAWRATVAELERAVTQTQQELAFVPPGDPEGKVQRLEREFAAYQDALAMAANGSFADSRARPVVLSQATVVPVTPLSTEIGLFGAAAAVVGFIAGLCIAAIRQGLSRGIGEPAAAADAARAPLLGRLPTTRALTRRGSRRRGQDPGLDGVLLAPGSDAYEAVGLLRSRLWPNRDKLRGTVQVCSIATRDRLDAAITAVNLARSCAQSGTSCALVWADLRRPAEILRDLGVNADGPGLAEALAGAAPEAFLQESADLPKLSVLVPGTAPTSVVDLLSTQVIAEVVDRLAGVVDVIVVHTPPAGEHPDAQLVGTAVEASILVVSARTPRQDVQRAGEELRAAGADIRGVAFAGSVL